MSKWFNYYQDRIGSFEYIQYFEKKYRVFLEKILEDNPKLIHEFGCGIGNTAIALNRLKYKGGFFLSDKCWDMLEGAKKNTQLFGLNRSHFWQGDAQNTTVGCDVAVSHGVLEHFDDRKINKIVETQLKTCKKLVCYVPSNKYKEPSFGDERLLSPKEWMKIAQPDIIHVFNEGHDLALIWRNND